MCFIIILEYYLSVRLCPQYKYLFIDKKSELKFIYKGIKLYYVTILKSVILHWMIGNFSKNTLCLYYLSLPL